MTSTKSVRRKPGTKCSSTSALTVPNVVSGRSLKPSVNACRISALKFGRGCAEVTASMSAGVDRVQPEPEDVGLHARGGRGDHRVHPVRHLGGGVQRDRRPDDVGLGTGEAVRDQELPGGVGTVHLEALRGATVRRHQSGVVEQRRDVQQFGVGADPELAATAGCRTGTPGASGGRSTRWWCLGSARSHPSPVRCPVSATPRNGFGHDLCPLRMVSHVGGSVDRIPQLSASSLGGAVRAWP